MRYENKSNCVVVDVAGMHRLVERVTMENEPWFPGLNGVIADETSISSIGNHVLYRDTL